MQKGVVYIRSRGELSSVFTTTKHAFLVLTNEVAHRNVASNAVTVSSPEAQSRIGSV